MILNDFAPLYGILAETYYQGKAARKASLEYYSDLIKALEHGDGKVKEIVEKIMIHSQKVWQDIK